MSTKTRRRSILLSLAVGVGPAILLSGTAAAATDVWTNQAGTGNWSTSPTDANWSIGGVQSAYTDGDSVILDDSAGAGNTSIDLVGTLNPASVSVGDPTLNYSLLGSGVIGSGSLTKSGSGTLTLANSNENLYSGNTTILAGTLIDDMSNMASPTNLIYPGSSLVMAGGALQVTNGGVSSVQGFGGTILQAGASSIAVGGTAADNVVLSTISRTQGATVDFSMSGSGQVLTSNTNAYGSGTSAILGGYATVNGTDWATVNGSGNVDALSPTGYTANVWGPGVNTDVTTSTIGPFSGVTQSLRFNTTLGPPFQTVTLNAGAVIASGGILVPNVGPNVLNIAGGTLTSGNAQHDLIIEDNLSRGELQIGSTIVDNSGTPIGVTTDSIRLALTGSNTYTGPTIINGGMVLASSVANGGVASSIGASSNAASNLVLNGGTLVINELNIASSDRLFSLGPVGGTLYSGIRFTFNNRGNVGFVADAPTTLTLSGTYGDASGNVSDELDAQIGDPDATGNFKTSLIKNGGGTWLLTNSKSTFSGGATVNAGTLIVRSGLGTNSSTLGAGPVTVNNGGTLAGDGTEAFPTYVLGPTAANSGGWIVPSALENLIFQNGLTLNNGAALTYWLTNPGNYDPTSGNNVITSWGDLTIGTDLTIDMNQFSTLVPGTYEIMHYGSLTDNSNNFSGWNVDLLGAPPVLGPGQRETFSFLNDAANGNIDLVMTVVPEPASVGMLAIAGLGLMSRRRRRMVAIDSVE